MIGFAVLLTVATALAIVAGLLLWGMKHDTLRETDGERTERRFWAIVTELDTLPARERR